MAKMGNITIKIDTEAIVKVMCLARNCQNNLVNVTEDGLFACNLKHIRMNDVGSCEMFVVVSKPNDNMIGLGE
jgi:hypothetical protein